MKIHEGLRSRVVGARESDNNQWDSWDQWDSCVFLPFGAGALGLSFTALTAFSLVKNLAHLLDESGPNVFTVDGLLAVENSPFNELPLCS